MKKSSLLIAAYILLLFSQNATAQIFGGGPVIDPHKNWKWLETSHFEIIYEDSHRKLAEKTAAEAERAHILLAPLMKTEMSSKTIIVIADITDNANGMATGLPRNTIIIYPVLPTVGSAIDEYYDWIRELITHEYTHIQNFEPTSNLMGVGHFIFGNILKPNQFLPRWYAEGLAVEMESRLTPLGRGRSHYYSALDRSFLEGDVWGKYDISEINSTGNPSWPRGQRPYYLGYDLIHYMGQIKNNIGVPPSEIYGYLNNRYGGRFPYFINDPIEEAYAKDYVGLFADMQLNKKFNALTQMELLKKHGAKNGEVLKQNGYYNIGAQISPDGLKLAAIVMEFNSDPAIKVWTRKNTNESFSQITEVPRTITSGKDINQLSWKKDSTTIVFDKIQTINHFASFNDLFEISINPEKAEAKELTHGLRAREPAVLPNGSIVFILIGPTQTSLAKVDAQGKNLEILHKAPDGERLSSPRIYQGNVIYSHRDSKGREWIETFNLKTKEVTALTKALKPGDTQVMPSAFNDGFIFTGSQSGVLNIYKNENGKISPLTNVTTLATSAVHDPWKRDIIYSRLTSNGFQIETTSVKLDYALTLAKVESNNKYSAAEENPAPPTKVSEEEDYSGMSYLMPHYWYPFISIVPGGAIFDAITGGSDPLSHHEYNLDLGYDTRAQSFRQSADYTNSTLGFPISAAFVNDYEYLAGLRASEQLVYGHLRTQHSLQTDENKWIISPLFSYKMTNYPGFLFTEVGPGISLTYNNITRHKDYQISPEEGYSFSVGYNYFLPGLGNTSYQNINGVGQYYFSGNPLPDRHVIKLKASAWISPPQATILTGTQQAGGEYGGLFFYQQFVVRGYSYGEFIGNTLLNFNFEYRFPLGYTYGGTGTFPVFTKSWYAGLVFDAVTLDGRYYDNSLSVVTAQPTRLGTFYLGTGAEIKGDFQILYGWDLTFKLGAYYGLTTNAFGGFNYFFGMGSPF